MYHFEWVSDPGHAWLRVHRDLINELGWTQISQYSYHDNNEWVYLEEDSDATKFIEFLDSKGIGSKFSESPEQVNDMSFVRNLTRF